MSKELLNQSDYQARVGELETSIGVLANTLFELTGERVETPAYDKKECISAVNVLEAHYKTLKDKIAGKHPAAAIVAPKPVAPAPAAVSGVTESASLTEQLKKAKYAQVNASEQIQRKVADKKAENAKNNDGATMVLSGDLAGQPVNLRLKPVVAKSLTQKVAEARGCDSLAELNQRYVNGEFQDQD